MGQSSVQSSFGQSVAIHTYLRSVRCLDNNILDNGQNLVDCFSNYRQKMSGLLIRNQITTTIYLPVKRLVIEA